MFLTYFTLLMLSALPYVVFGIELIQPDSVVVKPDGSLTLTCKVSGYSLTDDSYATGWIRQPKGKPLEWINHIWGTSGTRQKDSLKNKFSISKDSSSSTVTLNGKTLQVDDTAVYYCVRCGGSFDSWGKGTQVTVASTDPKPPTLFMMSDCGSTDSRMLGCLASEFSPEPFQFRWTDRSGNNLTEFVQYSTTGTSEKPLKISHISVTKQKFDENGITCEAMHPSKTVKAIFEKASRQTPSLTLTLESPLQRDIFVFGEVTLQAVVSGNDPKVVKDTAVSCKVGGDQTNIKGSTSISPSKKIHNVTVNRDKWFAGEKVTCTIRDKDKDIHKEINFNRGDANKPSVVIYETTTASKVSLVCEVTSTRLGDVYIMWKVDNKQYEEGYTSAPIRQKDSTSVLSIFKVSIQQFEKSTISCAVVHANLDNTRSPLVITTSKSKPKCPVCPACTKDY